MEQVFNSFSLEGKTILITGASSGIGRQCAVDCSKMGAKVIAIGRDETRLQAVLSEMNGACAIRKFDLDDLDGINGLVKSIVDEHGKLDGFIHAAGIEVTAPVKLLSPSDYEAVYRTNVLSAVEIVKSLTGILTFNKGGSIVLISSISGVIARTGLCAYAASKGALVSASRVMALEMSHRGIRVNTISPGTVMTPMMQRALDAMSPSDRAKRVDNFPLGLGQPSDISGACVFLLSDAARWITGHNLIIDGGYTIQ